MNAVHLVFMASVPAIGLMFASCAPAASGGTPSSPASAECTGKVTPGAAQGPYYKAGSPEKTRLYEEGVPGEKLTLTGYVFDTDCEPIAHAWLDFWQANGNGEYDNSGYTLRGHQYSDSSGKYTLETVIPGEYPGRTPHIHVKVRANDGSPVLTTQLFVPGLPANRNDSIYQDSLLMDIKETPAGKVATFNFVIKTR